MLLDVQLGQFSFTKGFFIAEVMHSLSPTFNRDQLNLDRFKYWLPTSQLLVLDVCLFDAFA
ncbi:DUF645 family protein [Vibrio cholerae]|uniref:DUF645 family protein n=1 Tax=Vibrio cholerae TaxID=666 RepID=UPI000D3AF7D1|nr:DUF645 family protein [Vibrio cholerae]EGQ9171110.1 DUF645 family protein [Vibrio cholerae]EGR0582443.1 DUF645 family protein [Vibrio cholerae]EGR1072365.1 DUF645 family protein [Vibrio cholerae]EGR1076088.1 DUF645 family protein [Vibrio cholerae]EGR2417002.1 DUF645 family protein [Vibrio cholerae]